MTDELVVIDARTLRRADEMALWFTGLGLAFALGALCGFVGAVGFVTWVAAS